MAPQPRDQEQGTSHKDNAGAEAVKKAFSLQKGEGGHGRMTAALENSRMKKIPPNIMVLLTTGPTAGVYSRITM